MKRLAVFLFAVLPCYAANCGVERQKVKTSADLDAGRVDMTPLVTTIADLNLIKAPTRAELDAKPDTRFTPELGTYTVTGYLVGFKLESDQDFHIVIADLDNPATTMIVEMPSENCVPQAIRNDAASLRASWQARFGKATPKFKRVAVHKIKVQMTGIGFIDFIHGQTGVAKNGFELHRLLSWKEVAGSS